MVARTYNVGLVFPCRLAISLDAHPAMRLIHVSNEAEFDKIGRLDVVVLDSFTMGRFRLPRDFPASRLVIFDPYMPRGRMRSPPASSALKYPKRGLSEIADHVAALLLAGISRLLVHDNFMRTGMPEAAFRQTRGIRDRRLGLLGTDIIGRHIAKTMARSGVQVGYVGARVNQSNWLHFSTLEGMASWADLLVLNMHEEARDDQKTVSAESLDLLGPDGIVAVLAPGQSDGLKVVGDAVENGIIAGMVMLADDFDEVLRERLALFPNVVFSHRRAVATVAYCDALTNALYQQLSSIAEIANGS